jgi:hypothetical protein
MTLGVGDESSRSEIILDGELDDSPTPDEEVMLEESPA